MEMPSLVLYSLVYHLLSVPTEHSKHRRLIPTAHGWWTITPAASKRARFPARQVSSASAYHHPQASHLIPAPVAFHDDKQRYDGFAILHVAIAEYLMPNKAPE